MGRAGAGTGGSTGRSGGGFRPTPPGGSSGRAVGSAGRNHSPSPHAGSVGRSTPPPSRGSGSPPRGGRIGAPPSRGGGYGTQPPLSPRRGGGGAPPPPPRSGYGTPPRGGHNPSTRIYRGGNYGGCLSTIIGGIVVIIIVVIVAVSVLGQSCLSCAGEKNSSQSNTVNTSSTGTTTNSKPNNVAPPAANPVTVVKNEPVNAFNADCIIDELNWFDDVKTAGESLEFVYETLGIQPYIVFRKYDSKLTSDTEKMRYCEDWYSQNIKDEDTFLFMYFAEKNGDDVGYMVYYPGANAENISKAFSSIFEAGINTYWFTNLSTDDVIKNAFEYTCDKVLVRQ